MMAMVSNGLDFVFFFAVDYLGRGFCKVNPMLPRFAIRGQQTCMEDVMNGPGLWELELIGDRRDSLIDHKGAMTFRGEFGRSIREIKVPRLQPDPVSYFELVRRSLFNRSVERFFRLASSLGSYFDSFFGSLVSRGWGWLE
jgi:hypothetical protein